MENGLFGLPIELHMEIGRFLSPQDVVSFTASARPLVAIRQTDLWRRRVQVDFGVKPMSLNKYNKYNRGQFSLWFEVYLFLHAASSGNMAHVVKKDITWLPDIAKRSSRIFNLLVAISSGNLDAVRIVSHVLIRDSPLRYRVYDTFLIPRWANNLILEAAIASRNSHMMRYVATIVDMDECTLDHIRHPNMLLALYDEHGSVVVEEFVDDWIAMWNVALANGDKKRARRLTSVLLSTEHITIGRIAEAMHDALVCGGKLLPTLAKIMTTIRYSNKK